MFKTSVTFMANVVLICRQEKKPSRSFPDYRNGFNNLYYGKGIKLTSIFKLTSVVKVPPVSFLIS